MTCFKFTNNLVCKELALVRSKRIDVFILKSRIHPMDFYQQDGQEIKTSRNNKWKEGGRCPFHEDRKAGSFRINSENGAFKCFSCGASGGDIISYTEQKYDLTFVEACRKLSREWGV
jgi:DNA primase